MLSTTVPDGIRPDYVFLTCKAWANDTLIAEMPEVWLETAQVVVLQNGIGNQQMVADEIGEERTIAGMIIIGFAIPEPARVSVTVSAGRVRLGRLSGACDEKVKVLARVLDSAGIPAEGVTDVTKHLWAKVLYNASLNALGALLDVNYGFLLNVETWSIIQDIVAEAFAVLEAGGIESFWPDAQSYLEYLRGYQVPATFDHRPSMLVDIMKGRPTEIDFINGAIVKYGRKSKVATPVNAMLVRMIKALETRVAGCACDAPASRWQPDST